VLWPIARFCWTLYRVRRQYNDTVNRARHAARESRAANRPAGWSAPRSHRRKVVRPDEGEYVEWEEIGRNVKTEAPGTSTSDNTNRQSQQRVSNYFSERISDAEWEEINE